MSQVKGEISENSLVLSSSWTLPYCDPLCYNRKKMQDFSPISFSTETTVTRRQGKVTPYKLIYRAHFIRCYEMISRMQSNRKSDLNTKNREQGGKEGTVLRESKVGWKERQSSKPIGTWGS